MIKIIAKNYIKNDKKERFLKLAKELIIESRKEEGCIAYDIYESIDGRSLTFIEEWKDEEAIKSHNNSNHFKTIVPKLAEFIDGEMDVSLYKKIDL
ncbi:putative quinol monooxygenase [Brachyspira pilosicoli]|uniref:putative quinol monooxygenase n=1 Tax=Brachyspira pilosicoli TaxID=52584 RepID=UPI003005A8F3